MKKIDIQNVPETQIKLDEMIEEMGNVDLMVFSAGIGHINDELVLEREFDSVATNVQGFTTVVNAAFHHFIDRGLGHFVGISSLAAVLGGAAASAYNASKSYIGNYFEGFRQKAQK